MFGYMILFAASRGTGPEIDWGEIAKDRGHFGKVEGHDMDPFIFDAQIADLGTVMLYPAGQSDRRYFMNYALFPSLAFMVHRRGKARAVWQAPTSQRADLRSYHGVGTLDAVLCRDHRVLLQDRFDIRIQKALDARVGFAAYAYQPINNTWHCWFVEVDGTIPGGVEVVGQDVDRAPSWDPYQPAGKGMPLPITRAEKEYVAARAKKSTGAKL